MCADYMTHDETGLGGSDPLHYVWAAKPTKVGGRSRPNRGFRLRPFFSVRFRSALFKEVLR